MIAKERCDMMGIKMAFGRPTAAGTEKVNNVNAAKTMSIVPKATAVLGTIVSTIFVTALTVGTVAVLTPQPNVACSPQRSQK